MGEQHTVTYAKEMIITRSVKECLMWLVSRVECEIDSEDEGFVVETSSSEDGDIKKMPIIVYQDYQ